MKELFKKIFQKNEPKANLETAMIATIPTLPPQELFVNNIHPEEQITKDNDFGRLNKFLNYDHFSDGLTQGYLIHSEAGMQLYINDLKSRFRMEINALDELIRDLILGKQKKLIDLGDMLPNLKDQLKLEIESDMETREELKYQKMMSVEGEGWISQILYAFEKGYRKGMLDYINIKQYSSNVFLQ